MTEKRDDLPLDVDGADRDEDGFEIGWEGVEHNAARRFLDRLLPKEVRAWIPGQKIIAGVVLYLLADVAGLGGETVLTVPGLEVALDSEQLAAFVGFYLWPEGSRHH